MKHIENLQCFLTFCCKDKKFINEKFKENKDFIEKNSKILEKHSKNIGRTFRYQTKQ